MGFRACARGADPFEKRVRESYGANVVGTPRAGIEPLLTVARQDDRVEPRGHLRHFFGGDPVELPAVTSAPAAGLSGTRSAEVKAGLGLDLSAGFLGALGLPIPGAQLSATVWDGATSFTFEVRDVLENQVDLAALAKAIDQRPVLNNAATAIFLNDPSQQLLLVTRTLTSPAFSVRATVAGGQAVNAEVDGIADLLGAASAQVSWKREKDDWLTFRGTSPVTFGFAVVPCLINVERRLAFGLSRKDLKFGAPPEPAAVSSGPVMADGSRAGVLTFD
jgi:hypothetical protein